MYHKNYHLNISYSNRDQRPVEIGQIRKVLCQKLCQLIFVKKEHEASKLCLLAIGI